MRCGFIVNSYLIHEDGEYRYKTGEWRYVERLSDLFETVDICAKIRPALASESQKASGNKLCIQHAAIHDVTATTAFEKGSRRQWLAQRWWAYRTVKELASTWDFAVIMSPGWPAVFGWWFHRQYGFPYAISVRQSWRGAVEHRLEAFPHLRWLVRPYCYLVEQLEYRMLRDSVVRMASGRTLAKRYPDLASSIIITLNTALSESDLRFRSDTCCQRPIRLIVVAALVARKGIDDTLRSVRALLDDGMDLELCIVGEGELRGDLIALVGELGLQARVRLMGQIEDRQRLLDLLHASDIFVLNSRSEGFPRVIFEAMSQGLPVVATRVGGIPNLLAHAETALLVEGGSIGQTVDAIKRLVEEGVLRRRLIQNGFTLVEKILSDDPLEGAVSEVRTIIAGFGVQNISKTKEGAAQ